METKDIKTSSSILYDLKPGEEAEIINISNECLGDHRRRLLDLGFVAGTKIKVAARSPLGNPVAYTLRGTLIALRTEQAKLINVKKI